MEQTLFLDWLNLLKKTGPFLPTQAFLASFYCRNLKLQIN